MTHHYQAGDVVRYFTWSGRTRLAIVERPGDKLSRAGFQRYLVKPMGHGVRRWTSCYNLAMVFRPPQDADRQPW